MGVYVVAASLAERVAAVANGGEGLARLDALSGFYDESAGAQMGIVAEFTIVVLDRDEVSEAVAARVLVLSTVESMDNTRAHRDHAAAAAQAHRGDVPGMQTAAPMRGSAVSTLSNHPLLASGDR